MDKAYEKIKELRNKLYYLNLRVKEIEGNSVTKSLYMEKSELTDKNNDLVNEKGDIEFKLENLNYYQEHIKEWKIKTIIKSLVSFLGIEAIFLGIMILISPSNPIAWSVSGMCYLTIGASLSLAIGEHNGYYGARKELKSKEATEKKLEEINKKIELNDVNCNINHINISNIEKDKNNVINEIKLLEDEISKLVNLRENTINEYIKKNINFENILNDKYEQSKQLIKK